MLRIRLNRTKIHNHNRGFHNQYHQLARTTSPSHREFEDIDHRNHYLLIVLCLVIQLYYRKDKFHNHLHQRPTIQLAHYEFEETM